ncbi:MAG: DNA cytosine methyltransferase [Xanthomonadaceae bacterium]|nr:DNA cytosine methyltransferase [Xanthomonadaceae bacterium]
MSGAFYNEIDPAACAVLRELIINGVIAPGVVDSRPIQEVRPDDVRGFSQVHLFAGGGLWSVAARLAGWPDDRPLWTGSCPCQPFSQAGKGAGRDDPRHLWPDMFRLVRACRPAVVIGEQVAGKAGLDWFDGVAADLGGEDYACRAVDIPAASVDAPHIRQRLYWVAMADADCCGRRGRAQDAQRGALSRVAAEWTDGASVGVTLGDAERARLEGQRGHGDGTAGWSLAHRSASAPDGGGMVDASRVGRREGRPEHEFRRGRDAAADAASPQRPNGSFWAGAEWLACHDGKARRAEPGIRLLVDGMPGRIDGWRLAGNGLVLPLAAEVVGALMDFLDSDARAAA